ncbi:MAG: FAD-binding oxidoreductase [Sphaerobacteraceae bacterium]|nr:MAG: FAD-binding oxidoreductase [Sphaerobacteraceae bacterium]
MSRLPGVEVVVIGAGVTGAASAYELSKAGISTAIVEAGEVGSVASGASAGGVRQQGRDPRELPIAIKAIQRWPHLEQELDADLHYLQEGHVNLVEFESDLPAVEARVKREQESGLDIEMVYGKDLQELVPGVAPHVIAGSYCSTDGHAMPPWVAKAYTRAAVKHGAILYQFTKVTGLTIERDRITGVETSQGTIACDWVINAAGAWGRELAKLAGIDLPVETRALQMLLTEQMPPKLKQVLGCVSKQVSLKQIPTGSYLIGGGWDGSVYQDRRFGRVRSGSITGSAAHSSTIYPLLKQSRLLRAWTGLEAIATDGVPIIGPVPEVQGLLIACGFSGHGFALSPQIGVIMREFVSTGEPSTPVDELSIERFR